MEKVLEHRLREDNREHVCESLRENLPANLKIGESIPA